MSEPANDVTLLPRTDWPMMRRRGPGGALLLALRSYWAATPEERAGVCNGAGPRWLDAFLPWWLRCVPRFFLDRLWALNCREAFDIHDWDYLYLPLTLEGKAEADERLRHNLLEMIGAHRAPGWLLWLRLRMARRYVHLVQGYGYKAFFDREG